MSDQEAKTSSRRGRRSCSRRPPPNTAILSWEGITKTINPKNLLDFARARGRRPLRTLGRRVEFTVEVEGDTLIFTPRSSGLPRRHQLNYLTRVCDHYNAGGGLNPGAYRETTWNASYALALIDAYRKGRGA